SIPAFYGMDLLNESAPLRSQPAEVTKRVRSLWVRHSEIPQEKQHLGAIFVAVALSTCSYSVLQTVIVPALPAIQRQLETSTRSVTWALTSFLVVSAVSTPIIGRLGDMFGKKRVLLVTLLLFALGTVFSALATSLEMLIAGRAIQGLG